MLKAFTAKDRCFSLSSFPLLFSGLSSEIFGQLKIDDQKAGSCQVFFWGAIWALEIGVSKNSGTPEWMVYNGKPYYLLDDLGVPVCLETSKYLCCKYTDILWILVSPIEDANHHMSPFHLNGSLEPLFEPFSCARVKDLGIQMKSKDAKTAGLKIGCVLGVYSSQI